MSKEVRKLLSANDVGATGGHQAGILVPKEPKILSFFPALNPKVKNPRLVLVVREMIDATRWEFNYIYYNNKFFGGTRNEYRMTGMTGFFRSADLKEGDELIFSKDQNGSIELSYDRAIANTAEQNEQGVLVLRGGWKIINDR
jgi:hypothetical protein